MGAIGGCVGGTQSPPRSSSALICSTTASQECARTRGHCRTLTCEEHLECLRRETDPLRLERLSRALLDGEELPERALASRSTTDTGQSYTNAKPLL